MSAPSKHHSSNDSLLRPSTTVSFADVAHQTLLFDTQDEPSRLVLALLETSWVQRLRDIKQTGNTNLVYMFAEHSRFGHSLGVAYLAKLLMDKLRTWDSESVVAYQNAVAAAAVLHDIGHVAPGSHLAERIWSSDGGRHEEVSARVIREDPELREVLLSFGEELGEQVCAILEGNSSLPPWTTSVISGGGWNADRGNWAIVDSAMCSVSYGRYNVLALIDAFRLTQDGQLVIQENRLDALTHFYVARDSMYRQVYQHRVLQAVDALTANIVMRLRDLLEEGGRNLFDDLEVFCDQTMWAVLNERQYSSKLSLPEVFKMTESWWRYHLNLWCTSKDQILSDLSSRLRDRRLLKTVSLTSYESDTSSGQSETAEQFSLLKTANEVARELGYDPRYYVTVVDDKDRHRKDEIPPMVLLDSGSLMPLTDVEPMIAQLVKRNRFTRRWLAMPKKVKERLGKHR